ncbi:hypothetical protein J7E70_30225 [Variovorax paradoxus]|nr:hypothetical protein [Variovorax paradoxus]MBT2304699.1 hypothetical protein [Variovorax paradoxus]
MLSVSQKTALRPNFASPGKLRLVLRGCVHFCSVDAPRVWLCFAAIGSHYPTFRGVVNLAYWFWIFLAVCSFLGGASSLIWSSGAMAPIAGIFAGLLFLIVGRFMKEAALMLADLSDAAIRTAQK